MSKSYLNRTIEFHKIYQKEILPIFESYEYFRKKELFLWLCYLLTAILLVLMPIWSFPILYWLYSIIGEVAVVAIFFTIVFMLIGIIMVCKISNRSKNFIMTIKTDCLPNLLKVFGNIKWVNGSNIINDTELNTSGLFAKYNRRETDDEFIGTYEGVPFRISETTLWYETGSSKTKTVVPVFKGVVISFKSNKIIKNRTVVATKRDLTKKNTYWIYLALLIHPIMSVILNYKNLLNWIITLIIIAVFLFQYHKEQRNQELLETVKLEDPKFCNKFNVYSSDQVEARYLVTTAFMERFQKLNTSFASKKAKCSFCGDEIFFAINTNKNLFEIGSLFHSLKNPKSINDFYNELSSILELVKYFKLNEKTGL